jgi:hypothetical protein
MLMTSIVKAKAKRCIDKGLNAAHILAAQNFAIVDAAAR